jgi:RsbT co-antagonist protein rsbRD N-terminal domain
MNPGTKDEVGGSVREVKGSVKEIAGKVTNKSAGAVAVENVADILERDLDAVIREWLMRVDKEPELTAIPLSFEDRTGHLPQLLRDVIVRLRLDDETKAPISEAAAHHGDLRAQQGYTVAMAVEESRLLQVSIFTTLHKSQSHLEFDTVLPAVVTIADEVDAQLKQQMLRFMASDVAKLVATTKWQK